MPELSRFYGIVIQMYYGDHLPPHFHARYAGQSIKVDIGTLAVIEIRIDNQRLTHDASAF